MKKDYSVLLIQLDGNLASDVSTRCSAMFVESRELNNYVIIEIRSDSKGTIFIVLKLKVNQR